jgi:hypothetical protein
MSPLDLLRSLNQISLQLCLTTFPPPLPLDLFPAGGAELFGEELGDVVQGDLFNEAYAGMNASQHVFETWASSLARLSQISDETC